MPERPDPAERRTRYAAAIAVRDGDTWPTTYENDEADYLRRADAAIAVTDAELVAEQVSAPAEVWTVWPEDEPILGHYADEVTAKLAAIEFQQEAEGPGHDFVYSWDQHGGHLGLLANGDDTGFRVKRNQVQGKSETAVQADELARLRAVDAAYTALVHHAHDMNDDHLIDAIARVNRETDTHPAVPSASAATDLRERVADGDLPRVTRDGDGFLLHIPEVTYLDTQVWSVDIGLTTDGLRALRDAADTELRRLADDATRQSRLASPGRIYRDEMADALAAERPHLIAAFAEAVAAVAPGMSASDVMEAAADKATAKWVRDVLRKQAGGMRADEAQRAGEGR